jgi:hypothetical protein
MQLVYLLLSKLKDRVSLVFFLKLDGDAVEVGTTDAVD